MSGQEEIRPPPIPTTPNKTSIQTPTTTTPNQIPTPTAPNRIPTPSRTPTPTTQTPETTITQTTTIPKSPLDSVISPPDNPQNQNNPDSGTAGSLATPRKMYENRNKHSNQKDNDENRDCDKPRTNAKNNGKPILQSLQELLTEYKQMRQLPAYTTTNNRPTTTPTPEAVSGLTTPSEYSGRTESTCPQSENSHPLGKQEGYEIEKDNHDSKYSITGVVIVIPYNNYSTLCERCLPPTNPKNQLPDQCDTPKMGVPNSPIKPEEKGLPTTRKKESPVAYTLADTPNKFCKTLENISKIISALGPEGTVQIPGNNPPLEEDEKPPLPGLTGSNRSQQN